MRSMKGQSILEYVIVLTVIVAAVLAGALIFAKSSGEKGSTTGLGKIMDKAGGTIEKAGTDISGLKVK